MAIISLVGANTPEIEKIKVEENVKYRIFFGVFFDGTNNNMIQGSKAREIRSNHAKDGSQGVERLMKFGWFKDGRHKYEQNLVTREELTDIEDAISAGSFKDGYKNIFGKRGEYKGGDNGFSNVAILFSKYKGVAIDNSNGSQSNIKTIVYKIYVEGSGANDIKQWNTGIDARGLGFGLGKTGVVALVSKAIMAVHNRLAVFEGHENQVELNFDVFGFSRGAACARLFAYMVRRDCSPEMILKREVEFKKYYCKELFGKNTENPNRLSFLDKYNYKDDTQKGVKYQTKQVCFLGIYDTVVSIGMLRRKIEHNIESLRQGVKNILKEIQITVAQDINDYYRDINKATQQIGFLNKAVKIAEDAAWKELEVLNKDLQYIDEIVDFYFRLSKRIYDTIDDRFKLKNKFLGGQNLINPLRAGFFWDRDFDENLHDLNVRDYGMFSPQLGIPTFHICAMDEFRENFALTDVGTKVPENALEIFLPGCHSDIGGGYICNNEEKIVLNKYPTFSLEGLPLIKPEKGLARVFVDSPECSNGLTRELGLDAIQQLGWLPRTESEAKKLKATTVLKHDRARVCLNNDSSNSPNQENCSNKGHIHKNINCVQGKYNIKEGEFGEYEWWDRGDKIGWKRKVPSFFSNVTLHLMAERASKVTGRNIFMNGEAYNNKKTWTEGYYDIPEGLKAFYDEVLPYIKCNGIRKWIYPDNNYASDKYRNLRLKYLHFTSEQKVSITFSRLWDVQNSTKKDGYNNVISRIVYHGDKEDAGNMHYMFNYNDYIGDFYAQNDLC